MLLTEESLCRFFIPFQQRGSCLERCTIVSSFRPEIPVLRESQGAFLPSLAFVGSTLSLRPKYHSEMAREGLDRDWLAALPGDDKAAVVHENCYAPICAPEIGVFLRRAAALHLCPSQLFSTYPSPTTERYTPNPHELTRIQSLFQSSASVHGAVVHLTFCRRRR